jgi:hypothetical protein
MAVGVRPHGPTALTLGRSTASRYEEHGWVPGPVWLNMELRNYLAPVGFKLRTVQPIASRYTNYAVPAPLFL